MFLGTVEKVRTEWGQLPGGWMLAGAGKGWVLIKVGKRWNKRERKRGRGWRRNEKAASRLDIRGKKLKYAICGYSSTLFLSSCEELGACWEPIAYATHDYIKMCCLIAPRKHQTIGCVCMPRYTFIITLFRLPKFICEEKEEASCLQFLLCTEQIKTYSATCIINTGFIACFYWLHYGSPLGKPPNTGKLVQMSTLTRAAIYKANKAAEIQIYTCTVHISNNMETSFPRLPVHWSSLFIHYCKHLGGYWNTKQKSYFHAPRKRNLKNPTVPDT